MNKLKQSIKQYRNKNGIRFEHFTSNPAEFEAVRKECKLFKIKCRIIEGQLYKEIKTKKI